MARWVRDGDAPDKVPVSFVVTKADHPELVEWLWGLPFRKQSSVIRDILNEAAKMVSSGNVPARPVERQGQKKVGPTSAPAVVATSETQPSSAAMTEATAAILLNMRKDF